MKKLFLVLLITLVLCASVLTGCDQPEKFPGDHVHQGSFVAASNSTCATAGNVAHYACSCGACFSDEACTSPLTSVALPLDPGNHDSIAHVEETAATCVNRAKSEHYYCDDCRQSFRDQNGSLPVNDEDLYYGEYGAHASVSFVETTAPHCNGQPGLREHYLCADCGTKGIDQNIDYPVSDYELEDWSLPPVHGDLRVVPGYGATCMTSGMHDHYVCDGCYNRFFDENGEFPLYSDEQLLISPSAHQMTYHESVLPTCANNFVGSGEFWHCSSCQQNYGDPDGYYPAYDDMYYGSLYDAMCHQLQYVEYQKPTCTADGNAAYYDCENCPAYFDEWLNYYDDSYHFYMGYEKSEYYHSLIYMPEKAADCLPGNIECYACEYCDNYYNMYVDVNYPTYDYLLSESEVLSPATGRHNLVAHDMVAPTCTTDGVSAYWDCSSCEKLFWDEGGITERDPSSLALPATGHNWTHYNATPADCQTLGNIAYSHCNNCNRDFNLYASPIQDVTGNTTIGYAAHQTTYIYGYPATCTEDGRKESRYCSVCERYFENDKVTEIKDIVIPATGHSFHEDWIALETGHFRTASCGCDVESEIESHNELGYRISIQPTCQIEGTAEVYCNVCDYVVRYETLAPISHTFTLVPETESDCVTHGYAAHYTCATCVAWFDMNYVEKTFIEFRKPLDYTKHNYEYTTTAPTCQTEGKKVGTCTICYDTTESVLPTVDHKYEYLDQNEYYHRLSCVWCQTAKPGSYDQLHRLDEHYTCDICGTDYDYTENLIYSSGYTGGYDTLGSEKYVIVHGIDGTVPAELKIPAIIGDQIVRMVSLGTVSASGFVNSDVETVYLPAKLIEVSLFKGCTELTEVHFYGGTPELLMIAQNAFDGCTKLATFNMPASVKYVKNYAFRATALTSVEFSSLTQYGLSEGAFKNCTALHTVVFNDSCQLLAIPKDAFYGCTSLVNFRFNPNVKTIGEYAFYNCIALDDVALPDVLEVIERCAFYNAFDPTLSVSITLPETLTAVYGSAFTYSGVAEVYVLGYTSYENCLMDNINCFGEAFNGCKYLKNVVIGEKVEALSDGMFFNATSIETITFVDSTNVKYFGTRAFATLTLPLIEIEIGQNVQFIGSRTFFVNDNNYGSTGHTTATFIAESTQGLLLYDIQTHTIKYQITEQNWTEAIETIMSDNQTYAIVTQAFLDSENCIM